jgi:hypothetical protein
VPSRVVSLSVLVLVAGAILSAQHASIAPATYNATTTRIVIPKPPLPVLGPAGYRFIDPGLGSRMLRVTDGNTRPGFPGRSFVTASAGHQLAWNATSDKFWIRGIDGTYIPFTFNASSLTAARIDPTASGEGGLTIVSQLEPQFSFVSPNLLYGTRQSNANKPVIRKFDFNTQTYTDILDLGTVTLIANNTFARALAGSAAAPERLSVAFGGAQPSADLDYKVLVFDVGPPVSNIAVVDSLTSTITRDGVTQPTNIALGFRIHHQWIDQSGRYVLLYPTADSFSGQLPYFIWDQNTDAITRVTRFPGGHDALGYDRQVNQDCCTTTTYDGAQWQLRSLDAPAATMDVINPVLMPQEVFIADHSSWNNAQPGLLVPFLSSLYRYGSSNPPWRAWDDEIVAIQTSAAPSGATVWRFAHHRSDIRYDGGDGSQVSYFWYLPRAMISPDGRHALFTSNWEKTLGPTIGSDIEPGAMHRCDVFIVELGNPSGSFTDQPLISGITIIKVIHITELRARIDALRNRFSLGAYPWIDPVLGPGTVIRAIHIIELRTALQQAYAAAGRAQPTFTDSTITAGVTVIKAAHVDELRSAVVTLEGS